MAPPQVRTDLLASRCPAPVRADECGETAVWKAGLASYDPLFAAQIGVGPQALWPADGPPGIPSVIIRYHHCTPSNRVL